MAITLNSDPLDPACNTYVDEAGMLQYVRDRVVSEDVQDAWIDLTPAEKARYLVNATRLLDGMATWIGVRYSRDQRLGWPRVNAYFDGFYLDVTTVPEPVVQATCEMALWLLANSGAISTTTNSTYDSIKVGSLEVNFNEGVAKQGQQYFPEEVAYILQGYATLNAPEVPGRSITVARLERA